MVGHTEQWKGNLLKRFLKENHTGIADNKYSEYIFGIKFKPTFEFTVELKKFEFRPYQTLPFVRSRHKTSKLLE